MLSTDRDDKHAHFECVVKARRTRAPKADPFDSRKSRKGVRQEQHSTSAASGTKNVRQAPSTNSFGRSSWARPKESLVKHAEASERYDQTAQTSSRCPPQPSVVAPDPRDFVDAVQLPSSIPNESTPSSDTTLGDAIGFSMKQPMSSLLAEYGEQDLEWEKVKISNAQSSCNGDESEALDDNRPESTPERYESRLGQHGKAPIHVEIVSFGYHHGAPKEARAGWSYGNPLPIVDTRDAITAVPPYLNWQDGLSGNVKFTLLRTDGAQVRNLANDVAERATRAIVAAIEEGGHGYVSPLHAQVFVASESGRHRSVVVTEMAATALRNVLRKNHGNRVGCTCSVGTKHLHLERRLRTGKQDGNTSSKSKQKDLEDD